MQGRLRSKNRQQSDQSPSAEKVAPHHLDTSTIQSDLPEDSIQHSETMDEVQIKLLVTSEVENCITTKFASMLDSKLDEKLKPPTLLMGELAKKMQEMEERINTSIQGRLERIERTHEDEIKKIKATYDSRLETMQKQIDIQEGKIFEINKREDENSLEKSCYDSKFEQLAEGVMKNEETSTAALVKSNDNEQHGRRWALRFSGLKAPEEYETSEQAARIVADFVTVRLRIQVVPDDIDVAHRIGKAKDEKQTILARFFRRNLVHKILQTRTVLANSGFIIHEDSTQLNRKLLHHIYKHDGTKNSWLAGGKCWGSTTNHHVLKFDILDNLNSKIDEKLLQSPAPQKLRRTRKALVFTSPNTVHDGSTAQRSNSAINPQAVNEERSVEIKSPAKTDSGSSSQTTTFTEAPVLSKPSPLPLLQSPLLSTVMPILSNSVTSPSKIQVV